MSIQDDRRNIRTDFIRYNEYLQDIPRLKKLIEQARKDCKEELNDPSYGGSVVTIPDNPSDKDTVSMKWAKIIANLESSKENCERHVHQVNNWFAVLTPEQYRVIKVFLCEFKGSNRDTAAAILQCSTDNVKKRTSAGIERIRKHFKEIL